MQIIALGGGGFSMEPDNPLLDQYILAACGKTSPRVLFLPTASGDSDNYVLRFFAAFTKLEARPSYLSLFRLPTADLADFVLSHHVLYVGGGNTRSMLALWREWGIDHLVRQAWTQGVVLSGISAGAICWFEQGLTDSMPGKLYPLACLGLLAGSACPHFSGEPARRAALTSFVASGAMKAGYAIEDGVALHFRGANLDAVVASRQDAAAYAVERDGETARYTNLPARFLGSS